MTSFPLTINDFTVLRITPGDGVEQRLYMSEQPPSSVKIYNIPPFVNKNYLKTFLLTFGKFSNFVYDKHTNSASVKFEKKISAVNLLATPMTAAFGIPTQRANFSQVIMDAKKSWLKDSVCLKKESEDYLQDYFKEKLAQGFISEEEEDDWVVAKPKKRRIK